MSILINGCCSFELGGYGGRGRKCKKLQESKQVVPVTGDLAWTEKRGNSGFGSFMIRDKKNLHTSRVGLNFRPFFFYPKPTFFWGGKKIGSAKI